MDQTLKTENEQKKRYLKSYKESIKAVKIITDEIEQLRLDKVSPTVINDGMPHSSNCNDLSAYAAKLDELETQLHKERFKRISIYSDIIKQIEEMENETEKNVLRLKYIRCLNWEEVAVEMGYSWQHIHKLHGSALKNFNMR